MIDFKKMVDERIGALNSVAQDYDLTDPEQNDRYVIDVLYSTARCWDDISSALKEALEERDFIEIGKILEGMVMFSESEAKTFATWICMMHPEVLVKLASTKKERSK